MELIKLPLSRASGVFNNPLVTFLNLFGFAKNLAQSMKRIQDGEIQVNKEVMKDITYVCKPGDLVSYKDFGIVLEEETFK